jgi:hypothetical protein
MLPLLNLQVIVYFHITLVSETLVGQPKMVTIQRFQSENQPFLFGLDK